jgi:hypothetical protein
MVDPADPQDGENRSGGWYELAVEFGSSDGETAELAIAELGELAGVETAVGGQVLRLPDGQRVVCDFALVEEDGGSLWVILGLPLGSLGRIDPRVGAYPFGDTPGSSWRRPLDDWLASLALRLFDVLPFSLALVGYNVSGVMSAAQLTAGPPSEHHYIGIITVTERPTYHPATR